MTVKTKAQITAEINLAIVANAQGNITGPILNGVLNDLNDSAFMAVNVGTTAGTIAAGDDPRFQTNAQRVITAPGPIAITPTDVTVLINQGSPAPITLNLPAASTRVNNLPLTIEDFAGNSAANAITVAAFSGELINGLATFSINSNFESVIFIPVSGVGWIVQAAYVGSPTNGSVCFLNALNYGVTGNGSTNDSAAISAFLVTATNSGLWAYFPGLKTYDCKSAIINVPNNARVLCGSGAVFTRSADPNYGAVTAAALFNLGDNVIWDGGTLNNTVVLGTSTTSNTVSTGGTKTFTVLAGIPNVTAGTFLRFYPRSNLAARIEGTVASYSGTTLILNASFSNAGPGPYTDWNFNTGSANQCGMFLYYSKGSVVRNLTVTGNFYVGICLYGLNTTAGNLNVSNNILSNCSVTSVQNRGVYIYGYAINNIIENCKISAAVAGATDYGCNVNPSNSGSILNSAQFNKFKACDISNVAFHAIAFSDASFYNSAVDCTASNITNGVGFVDQFANIGTPQYNSFIGCRAVNVSGQGFIAVGALYGQMTDCITQACGSGYLIGPSGANQSSFYSIRGSAAINSTNIGIQVAGNSVDSELTNVKTIASGTNGIQIDSGATNTLASGRSTANTGTNLVNNGTGTVSTVIVV